ncbi:MAG: hypothetical protein LUE91_05270 [Oscillospiraceae bacterium]|nr:hypothetical protein [Oscillospiraceae bacterium]
MKRYYIDIERKKRETAGMKAPQDISEICSQCGMTKLSFPKFPSDKPKAYQKLWLLFVCTHSWMKVRKTVAEDSIVVYQHPFYGTRVAQRFIPRIQKKKRARFIAVVHDLESLRKGTGTVKFTSQSQRTSDIGDQALLKSCDIVICHNEHMKDYLVTQGLKREFLVNLEVFDYLSECKRTQKHKCQKPTISIAGYLGKGKCAYIYNIFGEEEKKNANLQVHLYGLDYEQVNVNSNMIYHGSFKPEELPEHLEGDFGLVWDGTSAETCAGNTGEYPKYNNPHKTSLYLASGMPVIVWSQAAIADFVLENGVGIAVDSLYGLDKVIANVSDADYRAMCENASWVGEKLRSGYYFKSAMERCLKIL